MENKEELLNKYKHIFDKLNVPENKCATLAEYAQNHEDFFKN